MTDSLILTMSAQQRISGIDKKKGSGTGFGASVELSLILSLITHDLSIMQQDIRTHALSNGMTLISERMPHVRSAAFQLMVPAGAAFESPDQLGLASILADMMTRGAGDRDSRQLSDALDQLGVDRSENAGVITMTFSGSTLARNLHQALAMYADILRRPLLPEEELEPARLAALQEIQSLDDEHQTRVMVELRHRYYPDPLGRDPRGTREGVANITQANLQGHFQSYVHAQDAILAIAGDIDHDQLRDRVEALFGDWHQRPKNVRQTASGIQRQHQPHSTGY